MMTGEDFPDFKDPLAGIDIPDPMADWNEPDILADWDIPDLVADWNESDILTDWDGSEIDNPSIKPVSPQPDKEHNHPGTGEPERWA